MNRPGEVWRKAAASGGGQNGDCVELSNHGRVRDSKNPDAVLGFNEGAAITALVVHLRAAN